VVNYGHGGIYVRYKTLGQAVRVVVRTAASSSSSFQAPLGAHLLRALKKEHKQKVHLLTHHGVPAIQIILQK